MEMKFSAACFAGPSSKLKGVHHIAMWNAQLIGRLGVREREEVKRVMDEMGLLSAQAQQLKCPVTSFERMGMYRSHRLYVLYCNRHETMKSEDGQMNMVVIKGMLKVGTKDLFIRRLDGTVHEMSPLCVLDFYVHHSCQRIGLGQLLFQQMLAEENLYAHQLGYYGLSKYVPQANQFVVFDAYFDIVTSTSGNGSLSATRRALIDSSYTGTLLMGKAEKITTLLTRMYWK